MNMARARKSQKPKRNSKNRAKRAKVVKHNQEALSSIKQQLSK